MYTETGLSCKLKTLLLITLSLLGVASATLFKMSKRFLFTSFR
jgi:hypothetical protein